MNEQEKEIVLRVRNLSSKIAQFIAEQGESGSICLTSICEVFIAYISYRDLSEEDLELLFSNIKETIKNIQNHPHFEAIKSIKSNEDLLAFQAVMNVMRSGEK